MSGGHIRLDYVPETRLEEENEVASNRAGFQASGRFKLADRFTLLGGGGAYYGFMDYRSLWLDEHFRQLYSRREGMRKRIRGAITVRVASAGNICRPPRSCKATCFSSTTSFLPVMKSCCSLFRRIWYGFATDTIRSVAG